MKTIQLNITDEAFKRLSSHATLKNLMRESVTTSDTFLLLVIEAMQAGKEEKTIQLTKK